VGYRDAEELDAALFESAFLWFEEESVFFKFGEDLRDQVAMSVEVLLFRFVCLGASVYCHVVHVDCEPSLCDFLQEDRVHHRLESRW
jgi:hypothetical protein